jgi:hypothetical protein
MFRTNPPERSVSIHPPRFNGQFPKSAAKPRAIHVIDGSTFASINDDRAGDFGNKNVNAWGGLYLQQPWTSPMQVDLRRWTTLALVALVSG